MFKKKKTVKPTQVDALDTHMINQHLLGNITSDKLDEYIIDRRKKYGRLT